MATQERLRARGQVRGRRLIADFAAEIRAVRFAAGLSQEEVGRRAGLSGDKIWRLEHERQPSLSLLDACTVAAVVGLDFVGKAYPNRAPIRDAAQTPRLMVLLNNVAPPLRYLVEAPLPRPGDAPELRAWDALLVGGGERTGIEFESRIGDFQATARRHNRKRADDPVDHFLLVVAGTKHNRRVMHEYGELLGELPRLRKAEVLHALRAGGHPRTGWIFI